MTKRIVVTGRVQGVGFRYFVRCTAEDMGVSGEVWNRRDGAVEAVAHHEDPAALDDFVERLHSGPGYVDEVRALDAASEPGSNGFTIGHTR